MELYGLCGINDKKHRITISRFITETAVFKNKAQQHENQTEYNRAYGTGGCHDLRLVMLFCTQRAGNEVARALPEEEAEGLDYCHNREYQTYCGGGLSAHLPYKIGVHHIIKAGYQHGDDGRYGK